MSRYTVTPRRFRTALGTMEQKRCWAVIAGEGTGSNFILDIGKKLRLRRRLSNETLSEVERTHRGEFALYP